MKNVILLSTACIALSFQSSFAQNKFKNEFKFVASSMFLGITQFQYERAIDKNSRHSLGFGFGINSGFGKDNPIDDQKNLQLGNYALSGYRLLLEYRYYLPKTSIQGLDGFYVGAYLKYLKHNGDVDLHYRSSDTVPLANYNMNLKMDTFTPGLQVGYKLRIKNHWAMDFMICGPGVANTKLILMPSSPLPTQFYADLKQVIVNKYSIVNVIGPKIDDFTFSNSGDRAETTLQLPTLRYGFSICYSF